MLIRLAMIASISYTFFMPAARFGVIRRNCFVRGSGFLGVAGHHPRDILHSYAELVLTNTQSRQGLHLIMLATQRTHYAVSFTTLRSAWCAHRSCDARLSIFRAVLLWHNILGTPSHRRTPVSFPFRHRAPAGPAATVFGESDPMVECRLVEARPE